MSVVSLDERRQSGGSDARALPANVEAEQQFLGCLLLYNEVFGQVAGFLKAEHFSEEIHRRIFAVAVDIIGEGRLASPITIKTFLGDHDLGGGLTIPQYLARLAADAPAPITARDYAQLVRDLFVRREIIGAARAAQEQAFDAPVDLRPAAMAAAMMESIGALTEDPGQSRRFTAGDSAARLIDRAQDIRNGAAERIGATTGFARLDKMTGGYRAGEFWIVAGRPGQGKTIVAATSATKTAAAGHGVKIFSLEVPEEQFTARLLADVAFTPRLRIPFSRIMSGVLNDDEMWAVAEAGRALTKLPLVCDFSSRLTVSDIRARIHVEKKRMAAQGHPLAVAFIDYLKFVQATDRYRGNMVYEVGEISAALKQIAKEEGICVVLLAQLNRALESREDKHPMLADLRSSGDLEADADVVAFIHREFVHVARAAAANDQEAAAKLEGLRHVAEIILGKNRSGPCDTVRLMCDVACSAMRDIGGAEGPDVNY